MVFVDTVELQVDVEIIPDKTIFTEMVTKTQHIQQTPNPAAQFPSAVPLFVVHSEEV